MTNVSCTRPQGGELPPDYNEPLPPLAGAGPSYYAEPRPPPPLPPPPPATEAQRAPALEAHQQQPRVYDEEDPNIDHLEAALQFDGAGEMAAAVRAFRACARFNPASAKAWANLAMALADEDNPSVGAEANSREAVAACREALALQPGHTGAAEELQREEYARFLGGAGDNSEL
jgi:tetratricopeptide (TPR) repeat protein